MPLNVNMEVQKKPVDEKQTMEMSQQQSMVVGGNKITFNIQINVTVTPIEWSINNNELSNKSWNFVMISTLFD